MNRKCVNFGLVTIENAGGQTHRQTDKTYMLMTVSQY